MTPSLTATQTETPTASPTWIETLVATVTGTTLTPTPVSTDAIYGVPTLKPDDAMTATPGVTPTFPVMPGIELTPALAFPSPEALALDLEPEQPLPILESTDFRDPHDVDWEFTEPVMEPSEDGTYWLHFRTPYAVRARLPDQNNVTLALNVRMTGGRVSIRTHYTDGIGYYRFSLSADGLLELARGETVVASVRLVPVQAEHWRSLRLAVTGRSLRASIDGVMVLHYVDRAPLPPGQVWLAVDGIPTGEVWIDNVQMTGSTPRAEIAPPPIDMSAASMNLSPFSTQPVVVFDRLMNATTGDHDLYRMNIDGSGFVALPGNTPGKEYEPVLSPDGKYIAFTAWRDGSTYSNNTNIWVMNSDGSGLWQVTNNAAFDYSPAWSPDGSRLAFVSNRGGVERVYVLYAGGSEVEGDQAAMISAGKDPSWSPDGNTLVISALNTATDGTWDLYLVDMTNYNYTRYHLLGESLRAELQPSWSSDSSAIVFTSIIYNGTVPEYTLRRVLRYAPYTVVTISSIKDAIAADYSPNGGELIWRLTSSPTLGGFARAASASPFGVTHYPVHNSSGNDFNPDWGNLAPSQPPVPPTPTVTPPMSGVWASEWIPLTYKYTNGTFNHPVQPLGNHPTTPNTYLIGVAFEWLTMIPSSDHIPDWQYAEGMNFNFRGLHSVQSNGGSFRHRRGVIDWFYRSQQLCNVRYPASGVAGMPNFVANSAEICAYYLPGSTAAIFNTALLVNGTSRGTFSPDSMSMSNWGVNMRGTARVRYFYWKQEISTPTPTPVPTSTMPPVTLTDFGIVLEDTWSLEEESEILRAAWETGRALSAHGAAATPVEAFREVLQGVNASNGLCQLRFNRISNTLPVCITSKTPDNPDYSASIGCRADVVMNQYTAVHEFGHVLVGRTGAYYIDRVEGPGGAQVPLSTNSEPPVFVMGPRSYLLNGINGSDWQRSDITTDSGWGSAGQWNGAYFGPYDFVPPPLGTPTKVPLYIPNLGPCGPGAPTNIAVPNATAFPFQQNPCTFPDWTATSGTGLITEIEEAAADMFLNWVYWKNYGNSVALQNQLWRSSNCYFSGCPDPTAAGEARANWMNATISAIYSQFGW